MVKYLKENEMPVVIGTDLVVQDNIDTRISNLTAPAKNFLDAFESALDSYDISDEEKKRQHLMQLGALEVIGFVPSAYFAVIEEKSGDLSRLVISQGLTPEQEYMLINFFKPVLAIVGLNVPESWSKAMIKKKPESKDIIALKKEVMVPEDEEPNYESKEFNTIFNIIYNLTGDKEYSDNMTRDSISAIKKASRSLGGSVKNQSIANQTKNQVSLPSPSPAIELWDDIVTQILNVIPDNRLKPEYVEYKKSAKKTVQKLFKDDMNEIEYRK